MWRSSARFAVSRLNRRRGPDQALSRRQRLPELKRRTELLLQPIRRRLARLSVNARTISISHILDHSIRISQSDD